MFRRSAVHKPPSVGGGPAYCDTVFPAPVLSVRSPEFGVKINTKETNNAYGGNQMKSLSKLALLVVAFALAACQQQVKSNVTAFNDLPVNDTGAAFFVMPLEHQEGSVEYRQYASRISSGLVQQGYRPVTNIAEAQYVVFFDYGADNGRTVSGSTPIWGQTGGGTTYQSGSLNSFGTYGSTYGTAPGAKEAFQRLNEAYRILGDPVARARYDAARVRIDDRAASFAAAIVASAQPFGVVDESGTLIGEIQRDVVIDLLAGRKAT
jgi:hypothetical protein